MFRRDEGARIKKKKYLDKEEEIFRGSGPFSFLAEDIIATEFVEVTRLSGTAAINELVCGNNNFICIYSGYSIVLLLRNKNK